MSHCSENEKTRLSRWDRHKEESAKAKGSTKKLKSSAIETLAEVGAIRVPETEEACRARRRADKAVRAANVAAALDSLNMNKTKTSTKTAAEPAAPGPETMAVSGSAASVPTVELSAAATGVAASTAISQSASTPASASAPNTGARMDQMTDVPSDMELEDYEGTDDDLPYEPSFKRQAREMDAISVLSQETMAGGPEFPAPAVSLAPDDAVGQSGYSLPRFSAEPTAPATVIALIPVTEALVHSWLPGAFQDRATVAEVRTLFPHQTIRLHLQPSRI